MNGPAAKHDAQKLLAGLRDHLARHDKPIAFFFGAGTSCAVQVSESGDGTAKKPLIPDVAGLTLLCEEAVALLDDKYAQAWTAIKDQCKVAKQCPNVENILSRCSTADPFAEVQRIVARKISEKIVTSKFPIKVINVQSDGNLIINYGDVFFKQGDKLSLFKTTGEAFVDPDTGEIIKYL